jgi:uncharacterized membrane protein
MGFRKWLLGFDPKEFHELKEKLNALELKIEKASVIIETIKEELDNLYKSKANVGSVKSLENKLSQLDNTINELKAVLTVKAKDKSSSIELSTEDKHDLILNLIKEGINTSSELRKHVPFSVRELHKILKELEELSAIGHIKKGRTKYYYVIEAKREFVQSKKYV